MATPQEQAMEDIRHYIMGRRALPAFLTGKKQRPFFYGGSITVANGASGIIYIQVDDDAHFLIENIQILSSLQNVLQDKVQVLITDTTTSRTWSNLPVSLRDLAGWGANAKYLQDPNILRPASTLTIQFTNNTGSSVTIYTALGGRKVYDLTKPEVDVMTRRLWYQYVLNVPTLAASAVDTKAYLQVYNESDFLVKKILSQDLINSIINATPGPQSAEVMVNFQDTTRDQFLFNTKLAARLVIGALASRPTTLADSWVPGQAYCLKKPWLIRRNGQICGFFDNMSTDPITNGFNITFEGIRIFDAA